MAKFKIVLVAVAIALVSALFVGFGIEAFYPTPKYADFCDEQNRVDVTTQAACEAEGGRWNAYEVAPKLDVGSGQMVCTKIGEDGDSITLNCDPSELSQPRGWCEPDYACGQAYDDARVPYERNVFIIATGLGIITLIAGIAISVAGVSGGLMGGGILMVIYGSLRYWQELADYGRFIILGIALAILIWLGYKKLK